MNLLKHRQSISHIWRNFFDEENLNKYLISRNFIRSILKGIYEEIDKQRQSIFGRVANKVKGNGNEAIKKQISELLYKIEDNEKLKDVEIPILQQRKNKLNKESFYAKSMYQY